MADPSAEKRRDASGSDAPAAHQPYVPDHLTPHEFTWPAVLVGVVLGIVFGASSLYLVLKVGMTISASIPVAVLSITLFRAFSRAFGVRRATILENNIVQTTGSAGESIAFGVGITMPAVMILGFEMEITRVMVVSVLGGMLGILMMIPLRRAFIVKQHGTLKYPEGTACADVLIVGETGGSSARTVFAGFGVAFLYQFLAGGLRLWKETVSRPLDWLKGATPALEASPALLGVGYIIGTRISSVMAAGGIMAAFVLIPAIRFFGEGLTGPVSPATTTLIRNMDADQLRKFYTLYVGAGAVAAGGILSLCRALPLIVASIRSGLRDMRGSVRAAGEGAPRTDRDMPLKTVFAGSLVLLVAIWAFLGLDPQAGGGLSLGAIFNWVNLAAALLIVLFGFLFVTVSSRLTGEIGSSSNPISGMTVATLLLTCLIFLLLGWTDPPHRLIALSVAAVVCIASSNGGTTSQDLKTGFLVGATPKYQQWAILAGTVSSALVIGVTLMALNRVGTVYSKKDLPTGVALDVARLEKTAGREKAPNDDAEYYVWHPVEGNAEGVPPGKYLVDRQGKIGYLVDPGISGTRTRRDDGTEVRKFSPPQAQLFALITHGILNQKLPWILVFLGVAIALVMELCGVSSLPFAVGVYLPLSASTPIFAGGLVRYAVDRFRRRPQEGPAPEPESDMSPGVLLSTGYIAGGTIAGVLVAFLSFSDAIPRALGVWQYRQFSLAEPAPVDEAFQRAAFHELGPKPSRENLDRMVDEIKELNSDLPPRYAPVPAGTTLRLPGNRTHAVREATTLGDLAREVLADERQASTLFDLNQDQLKPPAALPAGVGLKVPQRNYPAVLTFAMLAAILVAVGLGWIMQPPAEAGGSKGKS